MDGRKSSVVYDKKGSVDEIESTANLHGYEHGESDIKHLRAILKQEFGYQCYGILYLHLIDSFETITAVETKVAGIRGGIASISLPPLMSSSDEEDETPVPESSGPGHNIAQKINPKAEDWQDWGSISTNVVP